MATSVVVVMMDLQAASYGARLIKDFHTLHGGQQGEDVFGPGRAVRSGGFVICDTVHKLTGAGPWKMPFVQLRSILPTSKIRR